MPGLAAGAPPTVAATSTIASTSCFDLLQWCAVYTCPRHEKRVAEHLRLKSIETFLPLYRCVRKWKNGVRAEVDLPLFSGYLFTRIRVQDQLRVLEAAGVVSLVGVRGRPASVPESEIEMIRKALQSLKPEPHPYLAIGDRVRIVAGALAGFEGILVRKKHDFRVVLSVSLLMRSMAVEIEAADVARISTGVA